MVDAAAGTSVATRVPAATAVAGVADVPWPARVGGAGVPVVGVTTVDVGPVA